MTREDDACTAGIASALIADDDEYFRFALRSILVERLKIPAVSETESFDDAIEFLSGSQDIDLALFDLQMPGMDTRNSIRAVRETFPGTRVVVVSASRNRNDILRCLEAGAHGYVHKGIGPRGLALALGLICEGTVFVPPFLPDLVPQHAPAGEVEEPQRDRASDFLQRLTPRQREVLEFLVAGHSNKSIARKLDLSESAVKFHLSALFRHLGANNRVEAATHGARLLSLTPNRDS